MEQFANKPQTTLSAAITSTSATTCTVTSGASFPSSGTFRVLIESELIQVTAVSGTTWTIVKGDGGTTAATHANGSTIYGIVTKESLDALVSVFDAGTEVANRRVLDFYGASVSDDSTNGRAKIVTPNSWELTFTDPNLATWVWLNQLNSTVTVNSDQKTIWFYKPPNTLSGDYIASYGVAVPGSTFTATFRISMCWLTESTHWGGLFLFDNSTGHFNSLVQFQSAWYYQHYSSWSPSTSGTEFNPSVSTTMLCPWFKIVCNGTTYAWFHGMDGLSWIKGYSGNLSDWTASPTHVGVLLNCNSATYDMGMLIQSFKLT